jgi:hypothetical protein
MCICLEPTKTIFPDTNTQTNSRKKKNFAPIFCVFVYPSKAKKITALEKPWAKGTLIFLDVVP